MKAPEPPARSALLQPPVGRWFSRRTLFKLAGGALVGGITAEVVRVTAFTNVHTVIPGRVFRTAQLHSDQLQAFIANRGIRTVVNLRGLCPGMPWYIQECRAAHAANVSHEDITLSAKRYPAPGELAKLIAVFDHSAYPLVLHCHRGADRTGLAATIARLLLTHDTLAQARRQLSPRYGHVAVGRLAQLDEFFDYYQRSLATRGVPHTPDRFRRWVAAEYCPGPYRAALSVVGPTQLSARRGGTITVRAENTSVEPWQFKPSGASGVRLTYTLTTVTGAFIRRAKAGNLACTVRPGEHIDLACGLPPMPAGNYVLHADLTDYQPIELLNTNFSQYGSEPLLVPVTVS